MQFPQHITYQVHDNYTDCITFYGDLCLSKSTENEIVLWEPIFSGGIVPQVSSIIVPKQKLTEAQKNGMIRVYRKFYAGQTEIWWMKFTLNRKMRYLAIGSTVGTISLWDLDKLPKMHRGREARQRSVSVSILSDFS